LPVDNLRGFIVRWSVARRKLFPPPSYWPGGQSAPAALSCLSCLVRGRHLKRLEAADATTLGSQQPPYPLDLKTLNLRDRPYALFTCFAVCTFIVADAGFEVIARLWIGQNSLELALRETLYYAVVHLSKTGRRYTGTSLFWSRHSINRLRIPSGGAIAFSCSGKQPHHRWSIAQHDLLRKRV
jgi:hypothetical protein